MRVGIIGLGIMGAPMARNLLRAGHPLTVHTRTRARAAGLLADGAAWADSPAALAAAVDAVVTMLPDTPAVEAVMAGPEGVLAGARAELLAIGSRRGGGTRSRGLLDARGAGTPHAATGLRAGLHGAPPAEGPPPGARERGTARRPAAADRRRAAPLHRRRGTRRRRARHAGD